VSSPPARKKKSSSPAETVEAKLREVGLSWPEVTEHFPWGHRTLKVRGKAFVFMGGDADTWSLSLKLPESGLAALDLPFAAPTGYGLGKSGWVTSTFAARERPPAALLTAWLRESYEAVAPRRLLRNPVSTTGKVPSKPKVKANARTKAKPRAPRKPPVQVKANPAAKGKPARAGGASTRRLARSKAKNARRPRTVAGVRDSG